jgi:hypothetical protein
MKATYSVAAILWTSFVLLTLSGGCSEGSSERLPEPQQGKSGPNVCSGAVVETMNSGGYTYVNVDCGGRLVWAAGPTTEVAVGDEVSISLGVEMRDFASPSLERTFESIYFVTDIQQSDDGRAPDDRTVAEAHGKSSVPSEQPTHDFSSIDRPEGAKTVAEIYSSRAELEGVEILMVGKVVKFNPKIMGKNWIHIQDGTGEPGSNDLTVTTDATASVGDTVLVRGKVGLDKDMGAGYRYDILIEDAAVTVR